MRTEYKMTVFFVLFLAVPCLFAAKKRDTSEIEAAKDNTDGSKRKVLEEATRAEQKDVPVNRKEEVDTEEGGDNPDSDLAGGEEGESPEQAGGDTQERLKEDVEQDLKREIPKERMPEIEVTVEPLEAETGQKIVWRMDVEKREPEDRVILPDSLSFGDLEIVGRKREGKKEGEKYSRSETFKIELISLEAGDFELPPLKLQVVDKNGNISEVMTDAFSVTVKSLIANEPQPAIKKDEGAGEVVMEKDYTLIYIIAGLLAVVLIILATLLVRKLWAMRRPAPPAPPPPPRPAEEIAYEKLNQLKESSYLQEGMYKTFHFKLSETVREYLGNRYGFDSLERSTTELIDELRKIELTRELFDETVRMLEDTDLVKFAKHVPKEEESGALLEESFRLVDLTTDTAVVDDGGNSGGTDSEVRGESDKEEK